jgi:hypothetical protein
MQAGSFNIMKGYAILFSSTMMIVITAIPSITPWQLFQSICPYLGMQSPQCPTSPYQQQQQPYQQPQQQPYQQPQQQPYQQPQQQPYQQPQQQPCPNGSAPDVNGNCQIIQQQQQQSQQPPTSVPNTAGPPPPPSTSSPPVPSSSNDTAPQP